MMKKVKKLLSMMMAFVLVLSLTIPAYAMEPEESGVAQVASEEIVLVITQDEDGEISYEGGPEARIPGWSNILKVTAKDIGNDTVRISATNIALDWLDKVTVRIQIYNERGLQFDQYRTETTLVQLLPRKIGDFYIKGWTKVVVSEIKGEDEGDVGYLPNVTLTR